MNKIIKNTLILTAITVVSGLLLGIVYDITKEPIARAQEKDPAMEEIAQISARILEEL